MWTARVPSPFKALVFVSLLCLSACQREAPRDSGGALSATGPVRLTPQLSPAERLAHSQGASFFHKPWVSAPSITTDRDGLGPLFNAHSCASCHHDLGRGQLPQTSNRESSGLLFRLYGSAPFGEQLQNRALPGLDAEPLVTISREQVALVREFSDGLTISLFAPKYQTQADSKITAVSPRLAPPLIGVGLLDAIADDDIRALADPHDLNGDGISGRYLEIDQRPGRFGWKAEQPSLAAQVAKAFYEDIGITSSLFPTDNHPPCPQRDCRYSNGGNPEISDQGLASVVDYLSLLSVPQFKLSEQRKEALNQGWTLFRQAGCIGCHRVNLKTAANAQALLSAQKIHPFSDLLLHDMGKALADKADHELASEWRTAPLWGLGTSGGPYLHDGRAATLLEAILWHSGEAEPAVARVLRFNSRERAALLDFLAAL